MVAGWLSRAGFERCGVERYQRMRDLRTDADSRQFFVHGTRRVSAQNRRGDIKSVSNVLGAPSFSSYHRPIRRFAPLPLKLAGEQKD